MLETLNVNERLAKLVGLLQNQIRQFELWKTLQGKLSNDDVGHTLCGRAPVGPAGSGCSRGNGAHAGGSRSDAIGAGILLHVLGNTRGLGGDDGNADGAGDAPVSGGHSGRGTSRHGGRLLAAATGTRPRSGVVPECAPAILAGGGHCVPVPIFLHVAALAQKPLPPRARTGVLGRVHLLDEPAGLDHRHARTGRAAAVIRSEEHTSELTSRFGISYAVFCL